MLILLGGAIIVAVLVGVTLKGIGQNTGGTAVNTINCTVSSCMECWQKTGCSGYDAINTKIFDGSNANIGDCTGAIKINYFKCQPKP
jgi:hypothetical protein